MSKQKKDPVAQHLIDALLDNDQGGGIDSSDAPLELAGARASSPPKLSGEDRTLKIVLAELEQKEKTPPASPAKIKVDSRTETEIRLVASSHASTKPLNSSTTSGIIGSFSGAETALKQSESLRVAQTRISDLETEVERLRRENEKLAAAGETLRRRSDELLAKSENLETHLRDKDSNYSEERKVLRAQVSSKERELNEQRQKLDELEQRLETNFKKIRVRERDLEHRLEIAKVENTSLLTGKDKMILDLKRQVDHLSSEADYNKSKSHELYVQFKNKQETVGRVVRALRIALSILEGEDDSSSS